MAVSSTYEAPGGYLVINRENLIGINLLSAIQQQWVVTIFDQNNPRLKTGGLTPPFRRVKNDLYPFTLCLRTRGNGKHPRQRCRKQQSTATGGIREWGTSTRLSWVFQEGGYQWPTV